MISKNLLTLYVTDLGRGILLTELSLAQGYEYQLGLAESHRWGVSNLYQTLE